MRKANTIFKIAVVVVLLLFSYGNSFGQTKTKSTQPVSKTVQPKTKSTQPVSKSVQPKTKSEQPVPKSEQTKKIQDVGTVTIGTQTWSVTNLNASTFRNGDSIPEAKTNIEWVAAGESGKPAWCYYNNDPKNGLKYGKLYNWYAVNDPRGLAPADWIVANDADWTRLSYFLGGQTAGRKMKSTAGWSQGSNGTNESGFNGLPGGYRAENGSFLNLGSIGIWWSSTENKTASAIDHYLALTGSLNKSSSPKQRGESVRCIRY